MLQKIIEQCEALKKVICSKYNVQYTSQDARILALDTMQMDLSVYQMWMNSFSALKNKSGSKEEFLKEVGSNLSLEATESYMFRFLRFTLINNFFFTIDNLISNIFIAYPQLKPKLKGQKSGFFHSINSILENTFDREQIQISIAPFKVIAFIRNSFHNNGIHRFSENFEIQLGVYKYIFIQDKAIECASIEHVFNAIQHLLDALTLILLSDKVDWNKYIEDKYAATVPSTF